MKNSRKNLVGLKKTVLIKFVNFNVIISIIYYFILFCLNYIFWYWFTKLLIEHNVNNAKVIMSLFLKYWHKAQTPCPALHKSIYQKHKNKKYITTTDRNKILQVKSDFFLLNIQCYSEVQKPWLLCKLEMGCKWCFMRTLNLVLNSLMPITGESAKVVLKSGGKTVSISNERMVMNTFIKNTCLKHQQLHKLIFINT